MHAWEGGRIVPRMRETCERLPTPRHSAYAGFPQRLWMSHGRTCGKGIQVSDGAGMPDALSNISSSAQPAMALVRQHATHIRRVFHSGCGCRAGVLVEKVPKYLMPLVRARVAKHLVTRWVSRAGGKAVCMRGGCSACAFVAMSVASRFSTAAVDVPPVSLWKRHPSG